MEGLYHDWGDLSMGCGIYLAMTAAEFSACSSLPEHMAWMAFHFSPYGRGLSNLPAGLPKGNILILNDRVNLCGHDTELVARQLSDAAQILESRGVLLDLQRPGEPAIPPLIRRLKEVLPCPMAVSELYAADPEVGVFVSPCPPAVPPEKHLAPWAGRRIWLEAAIQTQIITVTEDGSVFSSPYEILDGGLPHRDDRLFCRYRIDIAPDAARFTLHRGREELVELRKAAEALGVEAMVGLYQELG